MIPVVAKIFHGGGTKPRHSNSATDLIEAAQAAGLRPPTQGWK
jgi:hypothetical protein